MKAKTLSSLIFLLPIASIVVTVALILVTYTLWQKRQLKESLQCLEKLYVRHAINMESRRISSLISMAYRNPAKVKDESVLSSQNRLFYLKKYLHFYALQKRGNGEYFAVFKVVDSKNGVYLDALDGSSTAQKAECSLKSNSAVCIIYKLASASGGDGVYLMKTLEKPKGDVVYYRLLKRPRMLIISGVDVEAVKLAVKMAEATYMEQFRRYRNRILAASGGVVLVVGVVFLGISRGVNRGFYIYRKKIESQREKLKDLVSYDELTGVSNRRRFNEIMEYEVVKSLRYSESLSLIMFDLDHFKYVNDRYGHQVGDRVLKNIAGVVSSSLRATDTLARWGGEEFFIVLPKTSCMNALKIAENLRRIVESIDHGIPQKVTCSFGVSCICENDTPKAIIKRADEAMYRAKRRGRNRVEYVGCGEGDEGKFEQRYAKI